MTQALATRGSKSPLCLVGQHRMQTVLALFQVGTIWIGSMGVGAVLKIMGFSDSQEMCPLVMFVRNWGFVLMLIPIAWVWVTLRLELHQPWYSKRLTLVTGLLLLASLAWFFILVAARAGSIMTRMGD